MHLTIFDGPNFKTFSQDFKNWFNTHKWVKKAHFALKLYKNLKKPEKNYTVFSFTQRPSFLHMIPLMAGYGHTFILESSF